MGFKWEKAMTLSDYTNDMRYITHRVEEEAAKKDLGSALAYLDDIKTLCERAETHLRAGAKRESAQ